MKGSIVDKARKKKTRVEKSEIDKKVEAERKQHEINVAAQKAIERRRKT